MSPSAGGRSYASGVSGMSARGTSHTVPSKLPGMGSISFMRFSMVCMSAFGLPSVSVMPMATRVSSPLSVKTLPISTRRMSGSPRSSPLYAFVVSASSIPFRRLVRRQPLSFATGCETHTSPFL